ncbi:c-type cytochrome [Aliiroseovarius marinus]|uniref:c-type cytochrome n=1 Tax=Aliiroseovarius marinus TaxID=2500159 RepID=UPI003D7EC793
MKQMMLAVAALAGLGLATSLSMRAGGKDAPVDQAGLDSGEMLAVIMPEMDDSYSLGRLAFGAKCAACHGDNAGGIEGSGPPLIHKIYEPSHHGDAAFFRAAELGVRAHHWPFGDMPPVEGITRAEVAEIIRYLRTVQRANGIS